MPNSYFRFKQFTIQQDRCSMKVCTDSCIFGAWTAGRLNGAVKVLDIGTGTGLLSLMLAQKNRARFDAIELDEDAFDQAVDNIEASPWGTSIRAIHADLRDHRFNKKYDFIISNPPFFVSNLRSPSRGINRARHDESLTLEELISLLPALLEPGGRFSILLPFHRTGDLERLASAEGFFPQEKLLIRQTPSHKPFRSVSLFAQTNPTTTVSEELTIRDKDGNETTALRQMMKDYYLRVNS
jgi:tRNA1Val (adenine37-N6)-methyltransferase